jgi:hypothetical protein
MVSSANQSVGMNVILWLSHQFIWMGQSGSGFNMEQSQNDWIFGESLSFMPSIAFKCEWKGPIIFINYTWVQCAVWSAESILGSPCSKKLLGAVLQFLQLMEPPMDSWVLLEIVPALQLMKLLWPTNATNSSFGLTSCNTECICLIGVKFNL